MSSTYSIGELERELAVSAETIRYYEREGLLPKPPRSAGNYRRYSEVHRERLAFIKNCRSLDMTLEEVRALLGAKDHPEKSCEDVNVLIDSHMGHVAERMAELRRLRRQLQELREQCTSVRSGADCAILKKLSDDPKVAKKSRRTHL
jgi:Cd(II)/Pb(II)-responsive transcriptional regulator